MIKETTKFQDSCVFEGMTSIRAIIRSQNELKNSRKIEKILLDKEKISKNKKDISYLKAIAYENGFIIEETRAEELEKLTLGNSHGGIVAYCSQREIPLLDDSCDINPNGFYAMIQGIEDPYNFGYALRSLYAVGCSGIVLPPRNWMSAAGVVCRSSAGASELFPTFLSEPMFAVDFFKKLSFNVVCADERTDNTLGECELKKPILLIVGGEKRGISRDLLEKCDMRVKIRYGRNFPSSLSAASAATIFGYEILRQNP